MSEDTITTEERALLRFPGSVPGVLRRGSPVEHSTLGLGVVSRVEQRDGYVAARWLPDTFPASYDTNTSVLDLDLTDATGRAHLAWWVGRALRVEPDGACTMIDGYQVDVGSDDNVCLYLQHDGVYYLFGAERVPGLERLDPDSPRDLPDGSRLVDALALSLVARHVAGLEAK